MQLNKELVPEDLMEQDQMSRVDDLTPVHDSGDDTEDMEIGRATARGWPPIPLQLLMQQPQGMARWPSGLGPPIVAGIMIGQAMVPEALLPHKQGGQGGTDTKS
jgi:hypothetical protein